MKDHSLKQIGITLAVASIVFPVILFSVFRVVGAEGPQWIVTSTIVALSALYAIGSGWFIRRFFVSERQKGNTRTRTLARIGLAGIALWFLLNQFIPTRTDGVTRSPSAFDGMPPVWEGQTQTMYGYPFPLVRLLDTPLENHGGTFIEWAGIVFTIGLMMYHAFVFICLILLFFRGPTLRGRPSSPTDRNP